MGVVVGLGEGVRGVVAFLALAAALDALGVIVAVAFLLFGIAFAAAFLVGWAFGVVAFLALLLPLPLVVPAGVVEFAAVLLFLLFFLVVEALVEALPFAVLLVCLLPEVVFAVLVSEMGFFFAMGLGVVLGEGERLGLFLLLLRWIFFWKMSCWRYLMGFVARGWGIMVAVLR